MAISAYDGAMKAMVTGGHERALVSLEYLVALAERVHAAALADMPNVPMAREALVARDGEALHAAAARVAGELVETRCELVSARDTIARERKDMRERLRAMARNIGKAATE